MRNPNRIYPFMNKLTEIWINELPDWRFGQLMFNFISETGDPFFWEEDVFLQKFKEYVGKVKGKTIE